jgi:hypothetical protein
VGIRIKFAAPETLRQAQRWQAIKDRYVIEGLCDCCAAQAAWAHQNRGDTWSSIHPPCAACQAVVTGLAAPTSSPHWRKIPQPESSVSTTAPIAMAENKIAMRASRDAGIDLLATTGAK